MAYSYVTYNGNGVTSAFIVPFSYLDQSHIQVKVDGVGVPFTFLTGFTVSVVPAPTGRVEVRRVTPKDEPPVNFSDGSVLREAELDLLAIFGLYCAQEAQDTAEEAVVQSSLGTALARVYQGTLSANPTVRSDGTPLEIGDLYYNNVALTMRVYSGLLWGNVGATVPGILNKPTSPVIATGGQTIVPVPGGYDPSGIVVFLNGSTVSSPDIDVTSGTNIVFAAPLTALDEVTWLAFGVFQLAGPLTPSDGSVADAKVAANAAIDSVKLKSIQAGVDALVRSVQDELRDTIKVRQYCTEGEANSTAGYQKAINYAIATGRALDISGNFNVEFVRFDNANGLRATGRGSIVGIATTPTDALVYMKNVNNVSFDGAWFPNANYNTNYTGGVWGYTDGPGQQCASLDLVNVSPVNCKLAWKFGNDARPDDLVSEINIRGGNPYGCPSVLLAIGAQTVITCNGAILSSLVGAGDAAWAALPQKTVVARGATVHVTGGELLHVQTSTAGLGSDFNALCQIEPIASATGVVFGKIIVNGALIESAARLGSTQNPSSLPAPARGALSFVGCHGPSTQDIGGFIETDSTFVGVVRVESNEFFATSTRANVNIAAGGNCHIYCDDGSFGEGFKDTLGGITGGIAHFPPQMVLNASNLNGQSLVNGAATTLKPIGVVTTGSLARFAANYNVATGEFTVPVGGLKNVRIEAQLVKPGLAGEWYVQIDGTSFGVRTLGTYSHNSYSIGSLNAGQVIKLVLVNTTGSTVPAGSATTDWFQIFASN